MHVPTRRLFFFNDTATTEIYTLSLHDALPIWPPGRGSGGARSRRPGRRRADDGLLAGARRGAGARLAGPAAARPRAESGGADLGLRLSRPDAAHAVHRLVLRRAAAARVAAAGRRPPAAGRPPPRPPRHPSPPPPPPPPG